VNRRRLLRRLSEGAVQNVRFADLIDLVEAFGFELARVSGSHHIFTHPEITELLNLQEVHGQAKPYQVRQFLRLVERYNLKLRDEK
jgi:predicted RNA binding protein YcfA (HicA-like mRNA interferase family)